MKKNPQSDLNDGMLTLDLSAFQGMLTSSDYNMYTIIAHLLCKREVTFIKLINGGFYIPLILGIKLTNDLIIKDFSAKLADALWIHYKQIEYKCNPFDLNVEYLPFSRLCEYCDKIEDKNIRTAVKRILTNRMDAIEASAKKEAYVRDLIFKYNLPQPPKNVA